MGKVDLFEDTEITGSDITEDLDSLKNENIVVFSRDWTVETIVNQISQGNIDLNPKFQRRNAWNDDRRSKLIETLILGLPVPEIVLAEDPNKKRSFLVIDGKQRLLTIAGFFQPDTFCYWDKPRLSKLKAREDLNNVSYKDIDSDSDYESDKRELLNADLRCTIVSNYKKTDILYDIFDRLNSGSVPLSTQELRQALFKGGFADYLFEVTDFLQPIHNVMGIEGPDRRLRDIETILRLIAFNMCGDDYSGNLKLFLDNTMEKFTKEWADTRPLIEESYENINKALVKLEKVFGSPRLIGRKFTHDAYEKRLNVVLLEVQIYHFISIPDSVLTKEICNKLQDAFQDLCVKDSSFRASIEATTKTIANYKIRYSKFRMLLEQVLGIGLTSIPKFARED
jgi:uncharacterized protein with ParB-like and HNH nuclease domain